mgnify:CR=1 FL=1
MPIWIQKLASLFVPNRGEDLPLSRHYREIMDERGLPPLLHMPQVYDIIEVTVVREADVIFRVLIRWSWDSRRDIAAVIEADREVVTAYWISPDDDHPTLDRTVYETPFASGSEEAQRQSRPDDTT